MHSITQDLTPVNDAMAAALHTMRRRALACYPQEQARIDRGHAIALQGGVWLCPDGRRVELYAHRRRWEEDGRRENYRWPFVYLKYILVAVRKWTRQEKGAAEMNGDELRHVRENHSLTQEQFAILLGYNANYLAQVERGEVKITKRFERLVQTMFPQKKGEKKGKKPSVAY